MKTQTEDYKICNDCGEEPAIYDLILSTGETIHVCELCDESYTLCNICGNATLIDESIRLNPEDERKTCPNCITAEYWEKEDF